MKYTLEERLDIGRRIYEGEFTCERAAETYGVCTLTAKRYLKLYREAKHLPCKHMSAEKVKVSEVRVSPSTNSDLMEYACMTREDLIRELVLAKINEARAKKGYEVKGVGVEKEYIVYDSKNTK